jgi:hypothetical protein
VSTYKNGPGNVPRLPDRVVDTLIDAAGVPRQIFSVNGHRSDKLDKTANVERLVHDTCEELLARLPAPDEDGERFRFMLAAAGDRNSRAAQAMDRFSNELDDDDPRPHTEQLVEIIDKGRAWVAAGGQA